MHACKQGGPRFIISSERFLFVGVPQVSPEVPTALGKKVACATVFPDTTSSGPSLKSSCLSIFSCRNCYFAVSIWINRLQMLTSSGLWTVLWLCPSLFMKHGNGSHRCPSLCRNHSGGDSVAIGIVSFIPTSWDLGLRQYLFGDNSALNKFNQPTS